MSITRDLTPARRSRSRVPATSANVGPGFDCFGLALDWREQVDLEVIESGYAVDVTGEGADAIPRDESHLVLSATLTGLADLGVRTPGLRLRAHNTLPHGRGLGSSSAAIVAGLLAACGLAEMEPDPRLGPAARQRDRGSSRQRRSRDLRRIRAGVRRRYGRLPWPAARSGRRSRAGCSWPTQPLDTAAARRLLPESVPHVDAAANSARAALLVHALSNDPALLARSHPGLAAPGVPEFGHAPVVRAAEGPPEPGCAAVISGAGPSVLVLGRAEQLVELASWNVRGFAGRPLAIGTESRIDDVTDECQCRTGM